MSDSEAERQRKLKAGRAKLMEFKQMKKKKKKEESTKSASKQVDSQNNSQSGSQPVAKDAPRTSSRMSASREASNRQSDADQDTENDAASLSSVGNSNPASPIPHEGGDISYTSDSEYTSAEESYTYSEDGGVDSLVVANLERNELKNRVIELEENLRGKQAVLKDLNKENYELRAKLQSFQNGSRQESSPSPVLRKELESVQETLRENQKRLEEINKENHDMRTKLAHTGHDDKSVSSKLEEMNMTLESKQQMLEALNFQNQELIKENNALKSKQQERSPDNSQSDSQVESLQESLKTKQSVLSELNKQNQELREKIHELSQAGNADNQAQQYKRKIGDLQSEMGLKDDEIERLKAVEISFLQTKEVMKELSLQSTQAKAELEEMRKRYNELETEAQNKDRDFQQKISLTQEQVEKVQNEYHNIVTVNNDHLMKIQILESQIATLDNKLEEKDKKMSEFDAQVSLAIGERDAVQLEARTQVEDFEERIKIMQEQLQKNGTSIRDYEAEISKATEELAIAKDLVAKSETRVEERNQQISLLEKKLEAVALNDNQFSNERNIYQEEIEGLKSKVEESQTEIAGLRTKLNESKIEMQTVLVEKDSNIDELEREKKALEKKRTEEVDNLQANYDRLLQEQQEESRKKHEEVVSKLNKENEEHIRNMTGQFERRTEEMTINFKQIAEAQTKQLHENVEMEQKAKFEMVQEEVTKAVSEASRKIVIEKEEEIVGLKETIAAKSKELENCQQKIESLKAMCTEKDSKLHAVVEKGEREMSESEQVKVEFVQKLAESDGKVNDLNAAVANLNVENEKLAKEAELLREKITALVNEKEEFGKDVSSLKQDYEARIEKADLEVLNLKNSGEKDKAEFLQFVKDCEVLKEKLQNSIESEKNLKITIESLQNEQAKSIEERKEILERRKEDHENMAQLKLANCNMKAMLDGLSNEKSENEAEIQMLKEKLEIVKTENNNEMIEGFNQSLERLKQEKDEQIRNLKEEIAHIREGNDKYIQKMQSDFDSDMKHVEDENHNLNEQLKHLKEAKDKEISTLENGWKIELENVKEKHRVELNDLKVNIERRYEEEQLKLKENHWQQLKRYEAERELELKRLVEEGEKSRSEALELLRQQLEEDKHREIHDIVCNMTKEQKDNAGELQADMERQLKKVQEERDAELRNMKQEYKLYKENKKLEMEELMSSQISKYQEEQQTLQKRLNKAEGRIRKLMNEKEELLKQDNKYKEELEDLRGKLANADEKKEVKIVDVQAGNEGKTTKENEVQLESRPHDYLQLKDLFEELRKDIHNMSMGDEQDLSMSRMEEKGLGKSFDQSSEGEFGECSLDKELSEITRLCKGEIIDLAYKLKSMKSKYEDREKELSEVSVLNQTLKEEVEKLEAELKNAQEQGEEAAKDIQGQLFPEVENLSKETPQKSFDIIDGNSPVGDLEFMTEKLQAVSAEVESKMKLREELDASLSDMKLELSRVRSEKGRHGPVVVEDVTVMTVQHEEAMIVPEVLEELEMLPVEEVDAPRFNAKTNEETEQKEESISKDMELEIKHLQRLLIENNDKQEQQKKEIKELRDALENERTLFAEQLRARVAKETEARQAHESRSAEAALRERKELANKVTTLEQRLKDKERAESELKDENWRLVNLLKDNSVELVTEKESLQEQLEKQEDIIRDLQQKMSTGDHVPNEIQEAVGRQLAALHRQRDALIDQLEQHKKEHQGYAKVVQEKAALEEKLREEKNMLSEKLRQKEALELELAAERAALNERVIELEKLREMLNGKEKLADELAEQRDELKGELTAIEERLRFKEEEIGYEREELEREFAAKDIALRKWEKDFNARETELIEHEESLRQNFSEILQATRNDFEIRNEENLRQLRTDLDSDYQERIGVVEAGLHDQYGQEISRLQEDHDTQMNRAKGEFEEKLLDLRRQLEEEKLRQGKTVKNVLEREHSKEMMDLGTGHEVDMEALKRELEEKNRLEIERIKWEYEQTQRNRMEDLQASLITDSAIRIGAARLGAEQEVERQLLEMQRELDKRLEERIREIEKEKECEIKKTRDKCEKEMREKVDEVMRDMQAEKEAEIEKLFGENSIEEKIRFFESQMNGRPDPQRVQANMELDTRHEHEMEKVKLELVQKCGDDDEMFHTLGEFESVQENYFQEKLKYVQEEHEIHIETIVKEYEILLLKTKNELDVLREDDFQRIRRLQDEIYAREEQIVDIRKKLDDEIENYERKLKEERGKHDVEMAKKNDDQIALLAKEKEVWENDKEREISLLKSQFDGWLVEKDHESEMRMQELRAMYENEMGRREMEFIQREEIIKANFGQGQIEAKTQMLESQHMDQLREQDAKHREELENAVVQLSANLKQDFNSIMADMKAKHEEEKMQMRVDFKKVKRDALDDLREELAVDYSIQLKEMRAELEHNKVAEIAKATTQISLKNAVDLENLRRDLIEKYEKEIEAIKEELQKDFEMNALRQAAEIEDMEIRHVEEVRKAKRKLEDDEREAIRRELEAEFSRSAVSHAEEIEELENRHVDELRRFREKYELEEVGAIRRDMEDDLAHNAIKLAEQMEELEMKHAEEMKRLRQKYERDEVDGIRQEMREESERTSQQRDQIREIELKHEEDLRHIKQRYERLLTEKTQELQSEVNVLRSLLEGSQKELRKISPDFVDAFPTAPPLHEMPGSVESLIIPRSRLEDGVTPSGSTETLIARFRDDNVVNALNDAYRDMSSDDGSRVGTSLSGSVPSLFYPGGTRYPVARLGAGHDEVEQNQEAVLKEMRRRFRPSDSDSGRSYDQMMEPALVAEDELIAKVVREKDDEMQAHLAKQKEDLDNLYQERIHNLEAYIHNLHAKYEHDVSVLKEKSLQLAEEKLNEVREEAAIEKVHLQKEAYLKMESSQKELNDKNEKILKKFIKEQEKLTEELKNDHIDELRMLKHELTMQHEKEIKTIGEKHSQYVLETRDRYENLLKNERVKSEKKHADDAKKLKHLMEKSLEERQKDLVQVLKDQYDSDLKHAKHSLEDDRRRTIDQLTKDHMAEIERVKANQHRELTEKFESEMKTARENARREYDDFMRRDLTEKVYFEIERAREEARKAYEDQLHHLENQLEDTHIQQLQTLQDVREKNKETIDELKRRHQEEKENAEKSHEEKIHALKDTLQEECRSDVSAMEINIERDLKKLKEDLDEVHSKELDELNKELTTAKAKLTALEEAKSITERTYTDTIQKLHEDYENEIGKLKKAVEKYRHEELEKHDKNVADIYNVDQRIIKQNFEQQMTELKKHYELMLNDLEKRFEVEKREWLEHHVDKYDKKMEEIKKIYEEERKDFQNELITMDDEHTKQMDSLMDKVKSLTSDLTAARKKTSELNDENVELTNKVKIVNDQYNTLVARHERQEEENSKYIKMISSDVEKCEKDKGSLKQGNERLLLTLSNAVRASVLIEDMINRHLDTLILETSRTESGANDSGARGNGARGGGDGNRSFFAKFFGGSPSKSRKDKTLGDSDLADWTQHPSLSGGSLLSDEGLELSFVSKGKLFTGPELDSNSEEIVRGAGERLHTAVEHLLRMLTEATRQTNVARQAYDEAVARANGMEENQRSLKDEIAEQLKKALENLEKEEKLRKEWENDARKKNSQVQVTNNEIDELKQKMDEVEKESKEKDNILRNAEERCLELESEKEILVKLKNDLELKLAEFRTHRDKDAHDLRRENEDLKLRLARASEITGEELSDVLEEIEDLKEKVNTLSDEKDSLKDQLKETKVKESKAVREADILKQGNIEILQTNKELLEQNETLTNKNRTLQSALEETLEARLLPQDEADSKEAALDYVDGGDETLRDRSTPSSPGQGSGPTRGGGGSPYKEILKLQDEIKELKDDIEIVKETNDNLCVELDKKHETELDLLNKISELEDELYRSAQEGFESEREDKETLIIRRRSMELNLKRAMAENEKLKTDLNKKEEELAAAQDDLLKAKEIVADRNSIFDELKTTKSLLSDKDAQFLKLMTEADDVRESLFYKDEELSTAASELSELRETVDDQRSTIESQDKKILDLLQQQESTEKAEHYVKELMLEIQKEKEMVVEKDNEIQTLLEKLETKRSEGDGEDAETKSKKVKMMQEQLSQKEKEIKKLKKAIEVSEEKRQELEQNHELKLQKTIRHIRTEMEQSNEARIAELKAEHQAEINRMLETSRVELTELGQQFEEQIGAAERVNLHLLENFFKNRTLNESQMPTTMDENTPVESLLNELQSEAEKIAGLVTSYQINGVDPTSIEELQNSWAKEKQILMEAVKALRDLVSKASNVAASDASSAGADWRAALLKAIEEVFTLDTDLLNAEIETLESIPTVAEQSADLISEKRKRLSNQRKNQSQILASLDNKDRESLLQEVEEFKVAAEELNKEVRHYQNLLEDVQAQVQQRELELTEEYKSQVDQEVAANSQLRTQLEQEKQRNLELETLVSNERNTLTDMRKTLESDEEKIRDLVNALEIERAELKEVRGTMTNEKSKAKRLEQEVKSEQGRSEKLQKNLDNERRLVEEITMKRKTDVDELDMLLQEKTDQQEVLSDKLKELEEEKSRLVKDAELEQHHSRKIESLCEELKSKAAQEKNERQRMEKIAERYQANLEEMTKLFENEKKRRMENETALKEKANYQVEAEEKGHQDAVNKEKLEGMLKDADSMANNLKNELDRAEAKIASQEAEIMSLQSVYALKIAEIKKQNAEKISEMSDIVAKSKHDFADEIERERATSRQLKDALNNLQLKFETSRSQYERLRQSFDEIDGNREASEKTPKSSPRNMYSVSSRALDPFVNRCNKLVNNFQEVIVSEQQRMTYGAERPSERHIKELQSTHDALGALLQELDELQQDLRALEQADRCDNSPIARLEQLHNKNEELRDHVRKLVKEKSELRANLSALEEQVMEYRKREAEIDETEKASREAELQLKSEQLMWEAQRNSLKSELLKLEAERNALERSLDMASLENANLRNSQSRPEPDSPPADVHVNKVADSGWTIQKIQKLYGRCLRAESFRKALIYQKKYLLFLLGGYQETEAITLSMIAKMSDVTNADGTTKQQPYGKSRAFMRFRTAARVVIATWRMKFLVKKWSKSVSKITLKSTKKDRGSNGSPSAPPESINQKTTSSDKLPFSRNTKTGRDSNERLGESRGNRKSNKDTEAKYRSRQNGMDYEYQSSDRGYETRKSRSRDDENLRSRPRVERYDKIDTDSDPSSYAAVRSIDQSPPRAYPRPASPKRNRESPPVTDTDTRYMRHSSRASSRSRSPHSQGPSPGRTIDSKHQRSSSASGLDDTNASLNAYIKKLELIQAKLKAQGADSAAVDSRRF